MKYKKNCHPIPFAVSHSVALICKRFVSLWPNEHHFVMKDGIGIYRIRHGSIHPPSHPQIDMSYFVGHKWNYVGEPDGQWRFGPPTTVLFLWSHTLSPSIFGWTNSRIVFVIAWRMAYAVKRVARSLSLLLGIIWSDCLRAAGPVRDKISEQ